MNASILLATATTFAIWMADETLDPWAETRGFPSYWIEVRLTYSSRRTHISSVSLRRFDDGWRVAGMYPQLMPQLASPQTSNQATTWAAPS